MAVTGSGVGSSKGASGTTGVAWLAKDHLDCVAARNGAGAAFEVVIPGHGGAAGTAAPGRLATNASRSGCAGNAAVDEEGIAGVVGRRCDGLIATGLACEGLKFGAD